ncbi:thioesterase II family protein [Marilutibacter chinensis]|uniref:Alpha/beta fold hydrolase n=1 Tax=Marilutibacter chinensis TaxID=2912247 RepID=A0ABS9HY64_9GAMM|nr:alpha/beta fold hydrolase [Lysobacter chinensis]MCF7223317.1 alpha/beta fold hydrolase [Lysobacter chinensis]
MIRTPSSARRHRLFCFPYAGGNAFAFARWQEALDPSIEVCAIQAPGRGARIGEAPIDSLPALLRAVAPEVARLDDLPFSFFGHSVGALVAFELARYLRLHGMRLPEHLIVSGCQAPQFRSAPRGLHALDDASFVNLLRLYAGTPPEVLENQELMALLLPTIRADFSLAENYRYRFSPLLPVPVSVFAGTHDENKGAGQVDGWQKETSRACSIAWFEGGHFFLNEQRDRVLRCIESTLLPTGRSATAAHDVSSSTHALHTHST